jgi:hypothetical protein
LSPLLAVQLKYRPVSVRKAQMRKSKNTIRPSKTAERILKVILPDEGWDNPVGDFEKCFTQLSRQKGSFQACLWYWSQIFILIHEKILNLRRGSLSPAVDPPVPFGEPADIVGVRAAVAFLLQTVVKRGEVY